MKSFPKCEDIRNLYNFSQMGSSYFTFDKFVLSYRLIEMDGKEEVEKRFDIYL